MARWHAGRVLAGLPERRLVAATRCVQIISDVVVGGATIAVILDLLRYFLGVAGLEDALTWSMASSRWPGWVRS